uniref:Bicarbonate transporter-like transmembrane domain-containing protein n=1 Tax=Chromera velia CCMP2878 TaxID=1169474 RepID=A0A0G4HWL4_9ALVE|eukprot:Cvel_9096.t1-p1 / transcript=Cvel_9096.t1 / gene=Cvel_9096 / organism=Chromera_velia_CCMP2878 / gene_product=Putative transporter C543.05c, putative / transcript_product=Putative transporter C543.05c, putative / location=Cvel_scaffold516:45680-50279(+) / protein_length=801 / sequence_SO=supercontig / SO=protein_coding / is_pseudo=false
MSAKDPTARPSSSASEDGYACAHTEAESQSKGLAEKENSQGVGLPKYDTPFCGFGMGMYLDLKRRLPHYWSDWADALDVKVIASTLFMFFTSIAPAITFASLLQLKTNMLVGTVEVLLSTAVTGILFALVGGQPLCVLGVTGPVSIFTITIYQMARGLGLPFVPFYGWTQIWAALMHMLLAVTNMCDLIRWVTRYSCETFGVLIAVIYLWTGIVDGIGGYFWGIPGSDKKMRGAYLQLIVALGTAWVALTLSGARSWRILNRTCRELIADYGASFSIIVWTLIVYVGQNRGTVIPLLDVPTDFVTTSEERRGQWLVDFVAIPWWGGVLAIIPGFVLTVLFFFDHNVSSLLAQAPEFGLKKGTAFHWDFFVVGVGILLTGLLGIPPTNGLIPQAPLHTKSLCRFKQTEVNGVQREVVTGCAEQRVSNLMQAFLIGLFSFPPFLMIIGLIPQAALDGLFIYMGFASFPGNQFAERTGLLLVQPSLRTSTHGYLTRVPFREIVGFTLVQLVICGCIFGITKTPAGMAFPVLIAVLVPFRRFLLPKMFPHTDVLDHEGLPVETPGDDEDDRYDYPFEYGHLGGTIQRRLKHTRKAHSEDLQYQGYVEMRGDRPRKVVPLDPDLVGKIECVQEKMQEKKERDREREGEARSRDSSPKADVGASPLPGGESGSIGGEAVKQVMLLESQNMTASHEEAFRLQQEHFEGKNPSFLFSSDEALGFPPVVSADSAGDVLGVAASSSSSSSSSACPPPSLSRPAAAGERGVWEHPGASSASSAAVAGEVREAKGEREKEEGMAREERGEDLV